MGIRFGDLVYIIPAIITVLTLHEYSHAKMSDILGDPTPKNKGRLTLNPLSHLDPLGFLMLLLVRLGWAKPVPTNPMYYKNRKKGTVYVALAGPVSGIVLAFFVRFIIMTGVYTRIGVPLRLLTYIYSYSLIISVFNLLPVYPLDGSRILRGLLPDNMGYRIMQYQNQIQIVFMLIVFFANGFLLSVINPIVGALNFAINGLLGFMLKR